MGELTCFKNVDSDSLKALLMFLTPLDMDSGIGDLSRQFSAVIIPNIFFVIIITFPWFSSCPLIPLPTTIMLLLRKTI